jgi:hypothetical protein
VQRRERSLVQAAILPRERTVEIGRDDFDVARKIRG